MYSCNKNLQTTINISVKIHVTNYKHFDKNVVDTLVCLLYDLLNGALAEMIIPQKLSKARIWCRFGKCTHIEKKKECIWQAVQKDKESEFV